MGVAERGGKNSAARDMGGCYGTCTREMSIQRACCFFFLFFFFGRMLDSSAAGDVTMGFNDKSSKSGLEGYHKTPSLVLFTCDFNPV